MAGRNAGRWRIGAGTRPVSGPPFTVVSDPGALHSLAAEWWALWRSDTHATPFQSPAWLLAWMDEFAADKFKCVLVRRPGLSALVPLAVPPGGDAGTLELCGAGLSDYLDGIFAPDAGLSPDEILRDLCRAVPPGAGLRLSDLRPLSPLARAAAPRGWHEHAGTGSSVCPAVPLPAGGCADEAVPRRSWRKFAYARRRLLRDHQVERIAATPANAIDLFEVLVALHGRRWAGRDLPGVLQDPAVVRFHRAALPRLAEAGLLRLSVMFVDGRPAAALYSLVAHDRWHYYIGGFDPAHARLSLGTVMIGEAIEQAITEGCHTFDFLRGAEAYKYDWGAVDQVTRSRVFRRRATASR